MPSGKYRKAPVETWSEMARWTAAVSSSPSSGVTLYGGFVTSMTVPSGKERCGASGALAGAAAAAQTASTETRRGGNTVFIVAVYRNCLIRYWRMGGGRAEALQRAEKAAGTGNLFRVRHGRASGWEAHQGVPTRASAGWRVSGRRARNARPASRNWPTNGRVCALP